MSTVVTIIGPVFGLIALGYLAGRTGYLNDAVARGLPDFIFRLAMPIMLFRTIGNAQLPAVAPGAILACFFGAAAIAWLTATILTAWPLGRPARDGAGIAMGATFSNSVNIGLPIALAHYGDAAASIVALIVLCDTSALWLAATVHYAVTEHGQRVSFAQLVLNLAKRLATNPIILGCLAGLAWQLIGWTLPPVLDRMVSMLAAAAIPGALVAMGLALNSYALGGQVPTVVAVTLVKLLVMPLAAWALATYLFDLPPLVAGVVTLLAAMPVGANAYLFAAGYDRAPAAVSGAIALSTPLAVVTLSALLLWLGGGSP